MKIILKDGRRYMLRFQKGEEVFSELKKFLESENIQASSFSAIGACDMAEIAVYDKENKNYKVQVFNEQFEILSLNGNSAVLNEQVALHAHTVLSRADFSTLGGHASQLLISATCEMFLIKLDGKMERKFDEETKLNLLL
jgi:predicted DNA-binding protein with PD1-like motif